MVPSRVAVVSYHSSPLFEPGSGDAGGMTVYVRQLAHELTLRGVSTDIYTRAGDDLARTVEVETGVRVIPVEAGPRRPLDKSDLLPFVPDFVGAVRATALSQRLRYDIVHSHYWQSGLAGLELARSWGVPLVHSNHTLGRVKNDFLPPGEEPEPLVRIEGEHGIIRGADVLLASTEEEWSQLACLYGASHDNLKVVHPGVDHERFKPGDREEASSQLGLEGRAVLLCVGRVQPLKGLDLALRAVAELRSRVDREIVLLIAGGASGRRGDAELDRLASLAEELGLRDRVRFLGPQPHASLPTYYRAADAVLVCSHSESFGLVALEAQACGTPVIGTAVGGLAHIVSDKRSGYLVRDRDPGRVAGRIDPLLNDPALRGAFGAAAVDQAKRFSWSRTADDTLELYECLIRADYPEACTC